jgi:hypothetical protein|tara:strand:+ start:582 stop:1265 length:684 start_codon:yes stop_codon:yes gene_type:complete
MTKVESFFSKDPQSPFAPQWGYYIAENDLDIDVKSLSSIVLKEEKIIKEKYSDFWADSTIEELDACGAIGLGKDCLTSRFNHFNVLKWDYPVCKKLHREIVSFHNEYIKGSLGKIPDLNLKVRCWANVMRKGQLINKHCHGHHEHAYLSGNFVVQSYDTSTNYYHPFNHDVYTSDNIDGRMTMFPSWVIHDCTIHEDDVPRITIAFDIVLSNPANSGTTKEDNLVPL